MFDFLSYRFSFVTFTVAVTAAVLLVFQLGYYIIVYGKMLSFFKKSKKQTHDVITDASQCKGVSVIIIANNNGDALRERLIQVLEQEYPLFEVVVVNEHSTDDTEFILYVLKENYSNLKVINLTENANRFESRKFSYSIGIRSAKYDTVLITDVSCEPKGFDWLSLMMRPVNENSDKEIVTGVCLREKSKGVLNALVKYDEVTFYTNLIAYTLYGNAYTACGVNMCYDKDFFTRNGGFIDQYTNSCNQEDYFVHRFAHRHNTAVVADMNSVLYLPKYGSAKMFFNVKFATSLSRKVLAFKDKILLSLFPVCSFLFYAVLILLLILGFPWQYIVVATVIKWILHIVYYKKSMAKFGLKKYWIFSPLTEIYFFFFNFIIRVKVLFYRKKTKKIRWDK